MRIGKYLRSIGETLIEMAEEMEKEKTTTPSGADKPAKSVNTIVSDIIAESKADKGSDEKTASKATSIAPSKADVRKLLAKKSSEGFKEEVAELLKKYGEGNLSSVPEKKYAKLMKEAEMIGDGKEDSDA